MRSYTQDSTDFSNRLRTCCTTDTSHAGAAGAFWRLRDSLSWCSDALSSVQGFKDRETGMGCTDDRQCKDCGQAQHARPRRGLFHFKRLVHCWVNAWGRSAPCWRKGCSGSIPPASPRQGRAAGIPCCGSPVPGANRRTAPAPGSPPCASRLWA